MPKITITESGAFHCTMDADRVAVEKIVPMIDVEVCKQNKCGFFIKYANDTLMCSYNELAKPPEQKKDE